MNYYPLIGATDSFKDLIKIAGPLFEARHFAEMHITSRFTDLLMETLGLVGILMSCPVTHFSNPVTHQTRVSGWSPICTIHPQVTSWAQLCLERW